MTTHPPLEPQTAATARARVLGGVASITLLTLLLLPAPALQAAEAVAESAAESSASEPVSVVPGGLVRWGQMGVTACAMGDEKWEAEDGACYYPLDLLAEPGTVTLARRVGGEDDDGEAAGTWQTAKVRVGDYPYPVQHIELQDDSRVHLSPEDLERVGRERERIDALWDLRTPRRFALPLGEPLADLPQGGRFGSRRFFNGEPRSPHTGADFAAPTGTPVLAVAAGTVKIAEEHFFGGNSVFIDHGDGLISMAFHLSQIDVEEGDEVARGQKIGEVGSTGRSSGPHLHFGVRWRDRRIDPTLLWSPVAGLPTVE